MPDISMNLFLGGYGSEGPRGLRELSRLAGRGRWRLGQPDPSIRNASYAVYSSRYDVFFILDERTNGRIGRYRRSERRWTKLQTVSSEGDGPCFVSLNHDETAMAVANYESGSVACFDVGDGGHLSPARFIYRHQGRGADRTRQEGPHAHCVRFRGERLYSTDLGTDEILMHVVRGRSETTVAARMPGGQGPRHILFHSIWPLAYVLTELGSRLFTFRVLDDGRLVEIAQISTLSSATARGSIAGHLAVNLAGTRLYVSNRGEDSLVAFTLDGDGIPAFECRSATGAEGPRHFRLLEGTGQIVVAHQKGGRVTVLDLEPDGRIGPVVWSARAPEAAFVAQAIAD